MAGMGGQMLDLTSNRGRALNTPGHVTATAQPLNSQKRGALPINRSTPKKGGTTAQPLNSQKGGVLPLNRSTPKKGGYYRSTAQLQSVENGEKRLLLERKGGRALAFGHLETSTHTPAARTHARTHARARARTCATLGDSGGEGPGIKR